MNKKLSYVAFHALVVISFSMVIGMQLGAFIPSPESFENERRGISLISLFTMMMLTLLIFVTIYIIYDTYSRIVSLLSNEQKQRSFFGSYKSIPVLLFTLIGSIQSSE